MIKNCLSQSGFETTVRRSPTLALLQTIWSKVTGSVQVVGILLGETSLFGVVIYLALSLFVSPMILKAQT